MELPPRNSNGRGRTLLFTGILTAVYFVAGKLSLQLAFLHASASPVWPPSGIALGALVLFGLRLWPGIFVGAFLVNITTEGNLPTSLAIAGGNTLEAVTGAWLPDDRPPELMIPPEDLIHDLLAAKFADPAWIERL